MSQYPRPQSNFSAQCSYPPIRGNETHIRCYWPSIPYIALDKSSVLDMNRIPQGLFDNIDFVNTVSLYWSLYTQYIQRI